MKNKEFDFKRLTIEVLAELHKDIRRRALDRNITITRWVITAIQDRIHKEEGYEQKIG